MKTIKKGEKYLIESTVKKLDIELRWDAPAIYDMDGSAFLVASDGKVKQDSDMIFYNNPCSSNQSVIRLMPVSTQQEQYEVNLERVSSHIQKIPFVLTIHESAHTKQTFQNISQLRLQIRNGYTHLPLLTFRMDDFTNETALILFELYRYKNQWKINAVGSGYFGGLADICKEYGLTVEDPSDLQETTPAFSSDSLDIERILYENMVNRLTAFQLIIENKGMEQSKQVINQAFRNICEKDHYLERSIKSQQFQISHLNGHNTINLTMEYRTTKEQELVVDRKIKEIIQTIPMNLSPLEKVKAVHDFIVQSVEYDQTLTEYTAYAALIKRRTVCQGYAQLAYRLLNEVSIESIIIHGEAQTRQTGKRGLHAWNMVKIDGEWYHMDCTWDDPIGSNQIHYDYFLISDSKTRETHSWNYSKFPVASKSITIRN
ncbi:TerD family protein [Peribacillus loiseleuriae]|uniref:TerD family protein n=1 Tax=Peribacillus loiseleuriae TaxID=1679170 RepID=UPI0006713654|nr:TerD family protein [Peribacillus loiseleuriae]